MSDVRSFKKYFTENYLKNCFAKKLKQKSGGGKDRMSGETYGNSKQFKDDLTRIPTRIMDGAYVFTPYNEKLVSKGRYKLPRVISVPTMRDRLTLGCLNDYLKDEVGLKYPLLPPAFYIRKIEKFISESGAEVFFTKIDFSDFYGNISQVALGRTLAVCIPVLPAYRLVMSAVQTPTYDQAAPKSMFCNIGIPQGLAISNFLAAKYMEEFDDRMIQIFGDGYIRYVDDIMVLSADAKRHQSVIETIIQLNQELSLNLKLNPEKTITGSFESADVEFLGYLIGKSKIGVRQSTLLTFEKRLSDVCVNLRKQWTNRESRPLFMKDGDAKKDDAEFAEYINFEMRMRVAGVLIDKKGYGWLPYFKNITDVEQLYRLDALVAKLFRKKIEIRTSFVRAYYAIRHGDMSLMVNLDKIRTITQKKSFLRRKGLINPNRSYSDESIELMFEKAKGWIKKEYRKDIGHYYS